MANPHHKHQGNNSEFSGPADPDCFICKSIQKEVLHPVSVPVTFDGVVIGSATVDVNGYVVALLDDSDEARALGFQIRRGIMDHISLDTHDN